MADPVSIAINIALQAAIGLIMAVLTPKIREEGPRLDDRQVTTSTYGEEISLGYGTVLVAGNIIWGKDIEEATLVEDIGKGGLMSKGSVTSYEYFATFALAFSRREIKDVLRIYADGKLIYDKTDDDTPRADVMSGLDFTLYKGTMTQERDPLIEADVGTGNCPAFRGIAYIVFNRLPLQNFGRRIPSIRVVMAFTSGELGQPSYAFEDLLRGQTFSSNDLDPVRRVMISHARDIASDDYHHMLHEYDTGKLLYKRRFSDLNDDIVAMGGPAGFFSNTGGSAQFSEGLKAGGACPYYICKNRQGSSARFALIEKDTLRVIDWTSRAANIFDRYANTEAHPTTGVDTGHPYVDGTANFEIVEVVGLFGLEYFAVFLGSGISGAYEAGGLAICQITSSGFSWIWGSGTGRNQLGSLVASGAYRGSIAAGTQRGEFRDIYVSCIEGQVNSGLARGPYHIFNIRLSAAGDYILPQGNNAPLSGYAFEPFITIPEQTEAGGGTHQLWFNIRTGVLVWSISDADEFRTRGYNTLALVGDPATPAQLWERDVSIFSPGSTQHYPYTRNQITDFERATRTITTYDMDTGETVDQFSTRSEDYPAGDGITWPATVDNSVYYFPEGRHQVDPRYGVFYATPPTTRGAERLDRVVLDIVTRGRLLADDIDVTGLETKEVRGYLIARGIDYRTILEPLMSGYNFYGVEKNGKLVFDFHTNVPDVTIPEDDLLRSGYENVLEEARGQELETPRALYLAHRDPNQDDNKMVQGARRTSFPDETMNSVGEQTVELPLYLTVEEGARVVERILFESWIQRETLKFRLPPRYLGILPNDILTVTAEGRTEAIRANRVSIGSNLELEIEGNLVENHIYTQRVQGVLASGSPNFIHGGNTANTADRVTGWLMDMPLLRDYDLPDRTRGLVYFSAGVGATDRGLFPGAALYTSYDGSSFDGRSAASVGSPWGLTRGQVPNSPGIDWNGVQEVSIEVSIFAGEDRMASVLTADMIGNDANTAVLLKPNGEAEIIGFRDVTYLTGNTYRLTGLMRGKRGTNSAAVGYPLSGLVSFILMDPLWVTGFYESLARDEQTMGYRVIAANAGQTFSQEKSQLIKLKTLMPYEPAHVRVEAIAGAHRISWTRRTRQAGALRSGVATVAISEDAELYELEIYGFFDASAEEEFGVVRTVTGLTTPTFDYTDAMLLDDFFSSSLPEPLFVKVYQISAQVGRGFSTRRALYVED